jgi:hypothetical protein
LAQASIISTGSNGARGGVEAAAAAAAAAAEAFSELICDTFDRHKSSFMFETMVNDLIDASIENSCLRKTLIDEISSINRTETTN